MKNIDHGRHVQIPMPIQWRYDWQGNVRELQTPQRAVGLATNDSMKIDDIFPPAGRAARGVRVGFDSGVSR